MEPRWETVSLGACGAGMALSLISTLVGTHGANVDAVDDVARRH